LTDWLYHGKPIDVKDLDNNRAFVYVITNLKTGKKYYGKKRLQFLRRRKVPGRINRIKIVKESDWKDYWGSSKELRQDVEKHGAGNFTREILRICGTLGEASYHETKLQLEHDVLLHPDKYYNTFVGCRIHAKHLGVRPND
jgi:Putative endonuclease segE, GIY-YIG domain